MKSNCLIKNQSTFVELYQSEIFHILLSFVLGHSRVGVWDGPGKGLKASLNQFLPLIFFICWRSR